MAKESSSGITIKLMPQADFGGESVCMFNQNDLTNISETDKSSYISLRDELLKISKTVPKADPWQLPTLKLWTKSLSHSGSAKNKQHPLRSGLLAGYCEAVWEQPVSNHSRLHCSIWPGVRQLGHRLNRLSHGLSPKALGKSQKSLARN